MPVVGRASYYNFNAWTGHDVDETNTASRRTIRRWLPLGALGIATLERATTERATPSQTEEP